MKENKGMIPWLVFLGVLLSLLGYMGWQVEGELREVGKLVDQVAVEEANAAAYLKLENEYKSYVNKESMWSEKLVVEEKDVAEFARLIEAEATAAAVSLTIKFEDLPAKVDLGGKYGRGVGLELGLQGEYAGLEQFLGRLKENQYLVKLEKVLLSRGGVETTYSMVVNGVLLMRQAK